ncbi:MAG TPA: carbohydrate ABC transporter permease [Gaiellaceae bacterium]|nr:carbohydrate ABC transporter permease [Gaiellaceae bacterium]
MTTAAETIAVRPRQTAAARTLGFISRAPVHFSLIAIAVIWLVPTIGLAVTSFRPRPDIASSGWWTSFSHWDFTLKNYDLVLNANKMAPSFLNSALIAIPSTLLPLFFGALAAFAFSWIRFPFRDTIFLSLVALMVVPVQAAFVPTLVEFQDIGEYLTGRKDLITGTYAGLWIAHTVFALPFCIFLLRNFFITLPRDLIEAARVDGASNWRIFFKIVLPLSVPALASFGIFQFLWVWNDLLMALVYIQEPDLWPMTIRISQLLSTYGVEFNLLSSGAFLLMIVPLLVFFALQRYFVQGLLAGSVK